MKYILLAIIAIVAIQCQYPSNNPSGTSCAAKTTCLTNNGGICGNATTPQDPTKYCGTAGSFCDYLSSGKCVAKYATNAACNSSYFGQDCISGVCTAAACAAPATTTPAPTATVTYAYETNTCSSTVHCAPGLSCVGGTCAKYFASAVGSTCNSALDCALGNVCVSNLCATQTSPKAIGVACAGDSDCNTQTGLNAVCVCNSVGATAGVCGALDQINGLAFTPSAVTSCTALYNQYKNMATITASNAAAAGTNFGCVTACAFTHGPSTVTAAWAGYNNVYVLPGTGTIVSCVYTAPTTCSNPTTTGPTKASATSVVASLFLTVLALLF